MQRYGLLRPRQPTKQMPLSLFLSLFHFPSPSPLFFVFSAVFFFTQLRSRLGRSSDATTLSPRLHLTWFNLIILLLKKKSFIFKPKCQTQVDVVDRPWSSGPRRRSVLRRGQHAADAVQTQSDVSNISNIQYKTNCCATVKYINKIITIMITIMNVMWSARDGRTLSTAKWPLPTAN